MSDSVSTSEPPIPVLAFDDIAKEFQLGLSLTRVQAVRGVSLEVQPGEIFGFLGPNGAGKTTTMKMAMGLIKPTRGRALLFGQSAEDAGVRSRVGYLPEHPYFYDYLTATEILSFFAQLHGLPRRERKRRIPELLELVGLSHAANRTLRRFSKGMLQRVGIAQAIINDPDLVILDEPLSGLDPMGRKEVRDIIVRLREQGKTVFFSSHILHDIETICDRVAILVAGRVERIGQLQALLSEQHQQVEIVVTGLNADGLESVSQALGVEAQSQGEAVVFDVAEGDCQGALETLMAAGARVLKVLPQRQNLEALFVKEAETHGGS